MGKRKICIINGPNLNLLGTREKEIYGSSPFEEFLFQLKKQYPNVEIDYFQSNVEGEIINKLHQKGFGETGIILNAGGYTHTSVAIADAVAAIESEVVEVHISQPLAREEQRHLSLLAKACKGSIAGFGLKSYVLAIEYFRHK